MLIAPLLATLALCVPQATSLPFDDAGKALLELAAKEAPKGAPASEDVRVRLAPLHERVRLGAFELWVPRKQLDAKFGARPGMGAGDAHDFATELVALQGQWLERAGLRGAELDAARKALDVVGRFAKELRGARFPEPREDLLRACHVLELALLRRTLKDAEYALIVVLAPTRSQYLGALGAAGQLEPRKRAGLLVDGARRATSAQLMPGVSLVALTTAPEELGRSPLEDVNISPDELQQGFVHSESHVLAVTVVPMAPGWFVEGLAACDTIATLGADESLCTGCSEDTVQSRLGMGGLAGVLLWITRNKSPYRNGPSAKYFEPLLRAACSKDGLEVLDLDSARPADRMPLPMFTEDARPPSRILEGPPGVKKGFAELYRAYCACFVRWLDLQPGKPGRSQLVDLCAALAKIPYDPNAKRCPLYELAVAATGKTLAMTRDPATDLEGGFEAWLLR